jgi:hypothetical protein
MMASTGVLIKVHLSSYSKGGEMTRELRSGIRITVIPSLVGLALALGGCEKARLDQRVRELCNQDGGVKVYEVVYLSSKEFDRYGVVRVPIKQEAKLSDEFVYEQNLSAYQKGNPELWRLHFRVFRRSDSKLLGEAISYARRGGDMPGPWHESSFGCPERADISDLKKQLFIRKE